MKLFDKLTPLQKMSIDSADNEDIFKYLCVCAAGIRRSPTIAQYVSANFNVDARAAGTHSDALIRVNEALIYWADNIVFADDKSLVEFMHCLNDTNIILGMSFIVLDIPDAFDAYSENLKGVIDQRFNSYQNRWQRF